MKQQQLAGTFAFAATLLACGAAFAAGPTNAEYYPFQTVTSAPTVVKTNDRAVGVNTTSMGAKGVVATDDQSRQILMYLKAGG